ncbi:TetR/AcrR family transcriptional regulator [Nakamurella silvestris]|nr:TetR/AcrR family transcriptional regulator [Nakamurella silvestris]
MTEVVERADERISRRQVDKFAQRRDLLASSALRTLSELGYARTSLREIAQNSEFSHGVLHYYFRDKNELILHCVRQYKAECVTRYDHIIESASSAAQLCDSFAAAMAATLTEEAHLHRLWYDMRSQGLFEPSFRADLLELDHSLEQMIWRVVSRYAELSTRPVAMDPAVAYAVFDGLFQKALLRFLGGEADAAADLQRHTGSVLVEFVLGGR